MNLHPKELSKSDCDQWQQLTKNPPSTVEDWQKIGAFVLNALGAEKMVQLGDIQLWRHAISERSDSPLPPLNLPLSIWEAYLSNPFSPPIFHFSDGNMKKIKRWENVFYSWHSRMIAFAFEDDASMAYPANDIVAVSHSQRNSTHINVLERLRWFKTAQAFLPVCVRTKWGKAYLLEEPLFDVDHSGNILAIAHRTGMELIHVADIESVRSARDQTAILEQIVKAQTAVPFRPFNVIFCDGTRWTVSRPELLTVSAKRIVIAEGEESARGYERIHEKGVEWVDGVQIMPDESETK